MTGWAVRPFLPSDEPSWLRCRVLGFLDTAYYDDVQRSKPLVDGPDLVAVTASGTVAGILTTTLDARAATIDTVVVHPDHRRQDIARTLLTTVVAALRDRGVATLDAWTRDDPGTLSWYRAMGFTEDRHYLHVYADRYAAPAEPEDAGLSAHPGLTPMAAFLHGRIEDERWARAHFRRVHVCRRFSRPL